MFSPKKKVVFLTNASSFDRPMLRIGNCIYCMIIIYLVFHSRLNIMNSFDTITKKTEL